MTSFLQSPEWQEIQERMGRPTRRIRDVLVIRHDLPFAFHYLYAPRPTELSREFFQDAEAVAGKSGAIFLKIDPSEELEIPVPSGVEKKNFKLGIHSAHSLQPRSTVVIDCRKEDSQLLAAMHPKVRYDIRLAERHGVKVRSAGRPVSAADTATFSKLLAATARRDGFTPHPREHHHIILDTASDKFLNELFFAEYNGVVAAAAIVNFYQLSQMASYLHGGSSRDHREVMAPHLLHWRIIQEVKRRGFTVYDFGGIDPECWPGLTRFKKGFGGGLITFPQSGDIVFRPQLYRLYRLQRFLRHWSS